MVNIEKRKTRRNRKQRGTKINIKSKASEVITSDSAKGITKKKR